MSKAAANGLGVPQTSKSGSSNRSNQNRTDLDTNQSDKGRGRRNSIDKKVVVTHSTKNLRPQRKGMNRAKEQSLRLLMFQTGIWQNQLHLLARGKTLR